MLGKMGKSGSNEIEKDSRTSIYIHWPFCQSLCPYCDFNSYLEKEIDQYEWGIAYGKSISLASKQSDKRKVTSIYFGGGTPSLMNPSLVSNIINKVAIHFHLDTKAEITLEANPGSVDYRNFKAYSSSGVNRCSIGIQALNNKDLKKLGRLHTAEDALKAYEISQSCFKTSSFDLIYGRPKQNVADWETELKTALKLFPQHLSLYQLTIEPNTAFFELQKRNNLNGLPNNEKSSILYQKTKEICESSNLNHYEISNFSVAGKESVHNLNYWRYGDFIGIGPGAYGRVTFNAERYETETFKNPQKWLKTVLSKKNQIYSFKNKISRTNQAKEYAIMSLRLKEGLNISKFNSLSHLKLRNSKIYQLVELGLISVTENKIVKTNRGELLLNSLLNHLIN